MTKYNVVVIDANGVIIAVEEYNPSQRQKSVSEAASRLAQRLNMTAPEFRNSATDGLGNSWGRMTGDLQPGMVEIGLGKWGFPT